jgi:hypothetical protein
MSDFIDRFEVQLHEAAARELVPRARWRPRRIALAAFAAALIAGVPAAAEVGWFPFEGRSDAPSTTHAAPAAGVSGALGVLRRPQTDEDRGADSRFALEFVGGETYDDVQIDYVRRAQVGPGDRGVVLIPSGSHRLVPGAPPDRDVVCMWRTSYSNGKAAGGGRGCYGVGQIESGHALQSLGGRFDMLVPDGVARVEITSFGGDSQTLEPSDNVVSWDGSRPSRVVWFDGDGKELRTTTFG